jgi:hypothetical protein
MGEVIFLSSGCTMIQFSSARGVLYVSVNQKENFMKFRVVAMVVCSLVMCQMVDAQAPIVTHDELNQALLKSDNARKENLAQVRTFFSSDVARKAFKAAHLDPGRVEKAVSTLNSEELAKLAIETRQVQSDFAAGALTNQEITYILIALGTAVIVLILVR